MSGFEKMAIRGFSVAHRGIVRTGSLQLNETRSKPPVFWSMDLARTLQRNTYKVGKTPGGIHLAFAPGGIRLGETVSF